MKTQGCLKWSIYHYFGFLFRRGFKIQRIVSEFNVFVGLGNWMVILESNNCRISIIKEQEKIFIDFGLAGTEEENVIGIQGMVFYLTKGDIFIDYSPSAYRKQMKWFSKLLNEYIDKIILFYDSDFQLQWDELKLAGEKYKNMYIQKHQHQ